MPKFFFDENIKDLRIEYILAFIVLFIVCFYKILIKLCSIILIQLDYEITKKMFDDINDINDINDIDECSEEYLKIKLCNESDNNNKWKEILITSNEDTKNKKD